ncbi:NAD(P)-dependent alcohol dehydrogenase [Pseudidiomarina insulisalsae]|uniref:Hydroxyacid dehydrogenase n=1 Tax=Pseudidiomarina insulisalsae TaxID=575789 RepID=A0A432YCG2_9GAMM|nr:NAD(P)-dependent alcohol dehydrogenase [Pseudidiomarina insulisalsae]RUO58695.1 hydroxyacid dehydrogenase [Pseudidiomarina insulisalsae]
MPHAFGYAAPAADKELDYFEFERREPKVDDVEIEIIYCGVCHSDLHQARDEWGGTVFPCVPGHEIVGKVTRVGNQVTKFKVGDRVGVGCMVDSCGHCHSCNEDHEQYCENGFVATYNGEDKHLGGVTYGGYSNRITVKESFVLRVSDKLDLAGVAPLLCAGITTYSPLRHWNVKAGDKVGVVGLGGLGHMAVKLAAAMGAEVTLFTTSPDKVEDAKRLGAKHVVISRDEEAMAKWRNSLDFIINTVAAPHDLDEYVSLLRLNGTMCLVGVPAESHPSPAVFNLISKRRSIAGSLIGGIAETQEMLDFCAEHGITSDIELIAMEDINKAYERMLQSDVKYRFVIDMATLKQP